MTLRSSDHTPFEYWAFISYSHYDRRIARWLRDALKSERVPSQFRKRVKSQSSTFVPVFFDEQSARAGASLSAELERGLEESSSLIVICSPFAVSSDHVAEEIRYFQSLGRADRIFCIIASGVVNATKDGKPHLECLPEPLRNRVTAEGICDLPIAVHLGDDTKPEREKVVERVKAGVLDVSIEYLAGARRQATIFIALSIAVLIAMIVTVAFAFVIPVKTHARDYRRRFGKWEEIGSVSSSVASMLPSNYEFTRRGYFGRVTDVRKVDGFGNCADPGMPNVLGQEIEPTCTVIRACGVHLKYGNGGSVDEEQLKDQLGNIIETLKYTGPSTALYTEGGFGCSRSPSGIQYVKFKRFSGGPAHGLDQELRFLGTVGPSNELGPLPNQDGAYGFRFDYDSRGRLVSVTNLGSDGFPASSQTGYTTGTIDYDEFGVVSRRRYFDEHAAPVIITSGLSELQLRNDHLGRCVEALSIGLDGAPIVNSDGISLMRHKYGPRGQELERAFYDAWGHPSLSFERIANVKYEYDSKGRLLCERYYGVRHEPVISKDGRAGASYVRDKSGVAVKRTALGLDGKAIPLIGDRVGNEELQYDQHGNITQEKYFDADGRIARKNDAEKESGENGRALQITIWNERNQRVSSSEYGPDFSPTLDDDGISKSAYVYDANGNVTTETHYDEHNSITLDSKGISGQRFQHDYAGRVIEARFFGLKGEPQYNKEGYAGELYKYDSRGRKVEECALGLDGHLMLWHGIAGNTFEYNARGQQIKISGFGLKHEPANRDSGHSTMLTTYSARGDRLRDDFLDALAARGESK